MAIALALGSSLVSGCADFLGGVFSRRLPLLAVTVASQTAGFGALFAWLAIPGFQLDGRAFALGTAAGVGGAIGLCAFYKALALGTMSIVSPISACGVVQLISLKHRRDAHLFYKRLNFEPAAEGFRRYLPGFGPSTAEDTD